MSCEEEEEEFNGSRAYYRDWTASPVTAFMKNVRLKKTDGLVIQDDQCPLTTFDILIKSGIVCMQFMTETAIEKCQEVAVFYNLHIDTTHS